jgi:acyl-CoA thioester hydrolase
LHDLSPAPIMSYVHQHLLRVRYGETDQMGFVYYGVYAQYYEVARVEALRNWDCYMRTLKECIISGCR